MRAGRENDPGRPQQLCCDPRASTHAKGSGCPNRAWVVCVVWGHAELYTGLESADRVQSLLLRRNREGSDLLRPARRGNPVSVLSRAFGLVADEPARILGRLFVPLSSLSRGRGADDGKGLHSPWSVFDQAGGRYRPVYVLDLRGRLHWSAALQLGCA